MKINVHKEIFNKAYLPCLQDYSYRYNVFYGGAGSGKSFFVAQCLVFKALKQKRKVLVLRKTGTSVSNSVFSLLIRILGQFKVLPYCAVNKSIFTITLPNGSCFICSGLDDPEKIKSIEGLTDAWLEEATEFTVDDFSQIDLRIRDPYAEGQQIYLSFNPVSKANWCYLWFFHEDPAFEKFRKKVRVIWTTYLDNPTLPQEYIDSLQLKKDTNPVYYKIYALGEFGSLDKLVYQNWQSFEFDHTKIEGTHCCGLDFGYTNDPTALVCSVVSEKEKRIYIYREWGGTGYVNDEIAANLKRLGLSKSTIIADSADPKSIEEIKRAGILRIKESVKGPDSINHGIQRVQEYEIIVHPSCKQTIEELENYAWQKDKKTNEYINKPVDNYNHYLDALRYSMQCIDDRPQIRTMDKNLLF